MSIFYKILLWHKFRKCMYLHVYLVMHKASYLYAISQKKYTCQMTAVLSNTQSKLLLEVGYHPR